MQVVVNNPPDLFNPKERQKIGQLISAFENTDYTMQHNATMIWLDAFENKLQNDLKLEKIEMPKKFVFF